MAEYAVEISEAHLRVGMYRATPVPPSSKLWWDGYRLTPLTELCSLPALPRLPFLLPTPQALPVQLTGFEAPLKHPRLAPEPPLERIRSWLVQT